MSARHDLHTMGYIWPVIDSKQGARDIDVVGENEKFLEGIALGRGCRSRFKLITGKAGRLQNQEIYPLDIVVSINLVDARVDDLDLPVKLLNRSAFVREDQACFDSRLIQRLRAFEEQSIRLLLIVDQRHFHPLRQ